MGGPGLPSKPVMLAVRVPVLALAATLAWGCAAPSRPATPPVATGPVTPPATAISHSPARRL